nr:DUF1788 domain-containing protein [Methanobrevibacter smithii]
MDIDEKLSKIEPKIKKPSFLENKGLSNEVGYYIFDYDPKYELKVREEVLRIKNKINNSSYAFSIVEFDLYEIIIDILNDKGYLEEVFLFEEEDGLDFSIDAITSLLKLNSDDNLIVNYIVDKTPENCVVFLTGVGKAYPILRSHNVLNNLHQKLDEVPVVLFFPGKYSGRDLILFNTIEGSNYYRAFPLIS